MNLFVVLDSLKEISPKGPKQKLGISAILLRNLHFLKNLDLL